MILAIWRNQADTQITAWVDEGLDKNNYIVPGLGDFGDR
jgi:uracil phosphoribosyltransferase